MSSEQEKTLAGLPCQVNDAQLLAEQLTAKTHCHQFNQTQSANIAE